MQNFMKICFDLPLCIANQCRAWHFVGQIERRSGIVIGPISYLNTTYLKTFIWGGFMLIPIKLIENNTTSYSSWPAEGDEKHRSEEWTVKIASKTHWPLKQHNALYGLLYCKLLRVCACVWLHKQLTRLNCFLSPTHQCRNLFECQLSRSETEHFSTLLLNWVTAQGHQWNSRDVVIWHSLNTTAWQ